MSTPIDFSFEHLNHSIVFWGYGWKRRKWTTNGKTIIQWRDPQSGLWYGKKTAMKILETMALEQLNLN